MSALLFPLIVTKSNPAEGGRHLRLGWFALGTIKSTIKQHLLEPVTFFDHLSNRQLIFCILTRMALSGVVDFTL